MMHLRWTEWLPSDGGGFCWYINPIRTRCGRRVPEVKTTEKVKHVERKHCQRIMKKLKPGLHIRDQGDSNEDSQTTR